MADPGEDFSGFMDYLNAADAAEKEEQRIMAAHEVRGDKKARNCFQNSCSHYWLVSRCLQSWLGE